MRNLATGVYIAGGYFGAAGDDPSILMRAKEDYDGAEPAASSIAATNLFKLAALISGDASQRYLATFCSQAQDHCANLCSAACHMCTLDGMFSLVNCTVMLRGVSVVCTAMCSREGTWSCMHLVTATAWSAECTFVHTI